MDGFISIIGPQTEQNIMKTPMKLKLFGRFKDARNALKLTYEHLNFQKFSGVIPRPLKIGRGGKGGGERVGEGKGKIHPQTWHRNRRRIAIGPSSRSKSFVINRVSSFPKNN
jgi:hypothetical protein